MNKTNSSISSLHSPGCHCCHLEGAGTHTGLSRRDFLKVTGVGALGAVTLPGLTWAALNDGIIPQANAPKRQPLIVKPVFTYEVPVRKPQTSWRNWGGIQTEEDAVKEIERIEAELKVLQANADFPVEFQPVSAVRETSDINKIGGTIPVDLFLVYAAGGGMDRFDILKRNSKNMIIFCRHRSGPSYLWYEIISPRYLRQHTDKLTVKGIDENDIVIDSQDELLWRMRALCGIKNTVGSRILAIGGAGAWAQPLEPTMKVVREKYKLDIQNVSYDELGNLINEARKDGIALKKAKAKAAEYLLTEGTKLETRKEFVENCFVLEDILKKLMEKFDCQAITINNCMGTIMPLCESTACLTLSLLNDGGYLAFCESDFVVVPAGILMANISGKPAFLNDPTYPHNNVITLAHCTAPRRMDGKKLEPARILTHFESDYGAAPKVEMKLGQMVTNVMPDFAFERNVGMLGKIVDNPMLDICRSQIDIRFECDSRTVAEKMPGFHWITVYGDYMKEIEYALKKIGIGFENLG
jgi:hypothetical protein